MCFFCNLPKERIIHESDNFYVIRDNFPVTPLHTLIISKEHSVDWFDLNTEEQVELNTLIRTLASELLVDSDSEITGFNIGMNCGESAGQTVMHFHCHLIPRRHGDMEDPKGGVRGVIPEKQKYSTVSVEKLIQNELDEIFEPEQSEEWWDLPNNVLGNKAPRTLLVEGRGQFILDMIQGFGR